MRKAPRPHRITALDPAPAAAYIQRMAEDPSSIAGAQAHLAGEFQLFDDWMDRYQLLIDLGKGLDSLPEDERQDDLKVPGCQSQVWLKSAYDGRLMHYRAASDAIITSGLIALLLKVYSERTPQEILGAPFTLANEIGLQTHLSPSRANGFANMVRRVAEEAAKHI